MRNRKSAEEAMQEMLFDVKVEGLRAAYTRAKKILEDDAAPATAHASIISHMFRAGGLHGPAVLEPEKELHEMTKAELDERIDWLQREAAERASYLGRDVEDSDEDTDDENGMFS
jgi:hypothetical protein